MYYFRGWGGGWRSFFIIIIIFFPFRLVEEKDSVRDRKRKKEAKKKKKTHKHNPNLTWKSRDLIDLNAHGSQYDNFNINEQMSVFIMHAI